jgi:4-carboxymuconolactone decarboxylase
MMNRENLSKETMQKHGIGETELTKQFPDFEEVKNRLLYGEVWHHGKLDDKLRYLLTIAVLTIVEGNDLEEQLRSALKNGVTPAELKEVFHQAAPYIGFAKAEKGLEVFAKVCAEEGIVLPIEANGTVTEENRLEKGLAVQKSIFGDVIDNMRANAPEDQKQIQDYLSAYCFGDTYTRKVLDVKTRELITFVCIAALGGCEGQLKAHTGGNLAVGNDRSVLLDAINQVFPYIGFPRTLNALAVVSEVAK